MRSGQNRAVQCEVPVDLGKIDAPVYVLASREDHNFWTGGKGDTPERWLETAREVPGSWWPDWSGWLRGHAGPKIPARRTLGDSVHPPVEPAPSRYVLARIDS